MPNSALPSTFFPDRLLLRRPKETPTRSNRSIVRRYGKPRGGCPADLTNVRVRRSEFLCIKKSNLSMPATERQKSFGVAVSPSRLPSSRHFQIQSDSHAAPPRFGLHCENVSITLGGFQIYDIQKFIGFILPPPCLHLELIYPIKFMPPPLLRPLFQAPSPSDADIIH